MALTPEDVLNKNFTATQFRRGYDEQEVDDFLDEVVVELRRLLGENAELRRKLEAAQQGKGLQDSPAVGVGMDPYAVRQSEASTKAEIERIQRESEDRIARARAGAEQAEKDAAARISKARADAENAEKQAAAAARAADQARRDMPPTGAPPAPHPMVAAATGGAGDAAGVIALAQKLHDEYVTQGKAEHDRLLGEATRQRDQMLAAATTQRDQMLAEANTRRDQLLGEAQARHNELIGTAESRHRELLSTAQTEHDRLLAEANETHERLITEARQRSTGMVAEAQQKRQSVLEEMERTQSQLNQRIAELRQYEQDYRNRLRSFIEGQLHTLANAETVAPRSAIG
ncbi:DivIVA domain-containing protein [Austwickia chelonae]|uniref:Cell wall synthesis protein Wag31 n=1 Tax=Austwickia chelonae NBRC 105200 TaxID=1184607 RepID=K6VM59_9MICO|nr:DivIVA domain-containing protein [Austwickia chelonae]GAB76470.1 hypothetical protein AUCHE_01_00330 [Austwickia chelonae NBRC 105200]SEW25257.1 DivIVA domain-containing protein [Austwickia chelonae]